MKKKNILASALALVLVVGGMFTWKAFKTPSDTDLQTGRTNIIQHALTNYMDDYFDPQSNLGIKPYTFVGKIEDIDDIVGEGVTRPDPDPPLGWEQTTTTKMTVKVLQNLNGQLLLDAPILVYKHGGYYPNLQAYGGYSEGDNTIPKRGKMYLFNAYTSPSGTLYVSGPFGMTELEQGITKNNLDDSTVFEARSEQLENSYQLERYVDLPHYKSIYDESYSGTLGETIPLDESIPILKEAPKKWDENDDPLAVVELTPAILAKAITPPQQDTGAQAQTD
ncbi:MAG: hypothetical protein LBN05_03435 [Oscillospiraceae bacterium]|jgi:hypothetical protein|nr:hypothetical protein [Oscillospiraceae bacterium]